MNNITILVSIVGSLGTKKGQSHIKYYPIGAYIMLYMFVSHTELERGGFIVDDTIFVKCTLNTASIRHP